MMVQRVGNGTVELELDGSAFTLRWAGLGVRFGPCRSSAVIAGRERVIGGVGWRVAPGEGYGRAGTWVRQVSDEGSVVTLHVPDEGSIVVIEVEIVTGAAAKVDKVTPLTGTTDLEYTRRLVDGYDSWAYSGVRARGAGASFWNTVYLGDDGRALALQALDARRLCTRISNHEATLRVDCGSAPDLTKVAGTWGYLVGEQPPLGLPLAAGEHLRSEPIALAAGDDAIDLVETLAALAARNMQARHWAGPPPDGWESWYHYGLFVSADDVLSNARVLRDRYRDRPGFDLVQIDDGWQRSYGAWWPNERFPGDMGALVDQLRALGCRAGLWLAPFRVQPEVVGIAADHRDWCLRSADGLPVWEERNNTWALDASHPAALSWLHELGAQVRAWGFEMVKVDFCYLGALDGLRHDPRVTGIEALDRGFRAFVDGLGDDVYVLGCGMPVLPAVGLCHGNRVGHDLAMPRVHQEIGHPIDAGWTGFAGVRAQARNVAARWAQAGRWYDADPEVVMAWGSDGRDPAGYSVEEARAIATMVAVTGGPFLLADELGSLLDVERAVIECPALLDLINLTSFRPVDIFTMPDADDVPEQAFARGEGIPCTWATERDGETVMALFNWSDVPARYPVPDELIGTTELWTGTSVRSEIDVPAHGARVVRG